MLYLRFAFCLAVGLFGLALVLSTLFDVLFTDWDAITDLQRWLRSLTHKRTRFVLIEGSDGRAPQLTTRMGFAYSEPTREQQFLAPPDPNAPPIPIRTPAPREEVLA